MKRSLDGLSVGDAFGECFFAPYAWSAIKEGAVPAPPWRWTDDTAMSLSIVRVLGEAGRIDRDRLARAYAERYMAEPWRGYGGGAHDLLGRLGRGEPWHEVAPSLFGGEGSCGNGGAMRVAPLGAFFADEPVETVIAEARASAEPTHAHPEGQAGAIAIALAAAFVAKGGRKGLLEHVLEHTPAGETRDGIVRALKLPARATVQHAASVLGNGSRVTAQDTVPFALWSAARSLGGFKQALWQTVEALGDRDTTCAMVGGIVALAAEVPADWRAAREPLP
jgi:ADP-ribosylglycohydrolase